MANLMIVNYEASIVLTGTLHSILKLFIRLATDSQCHVLPELRGRSQEEDRDVVRGRDEARQAREEGVDALPSAKTTDLQNQHLGFIYIRRSRKSYKTIYDCNLLL